MITFRVSADVKDDGRVELTPPSDVPTGRAALVVSVYAILGLTTAYTTLISHFRSRLWSALATALVVVVITLMPAQITGCRAYGPSDLYHEYERVHPGQYLQNDSTPPHQTVWHPAETHATAEHVEHWSFGRFHEYAVLRFDSDKVLTGKRYVRICAEAFLLFAWQYEGGFSEWEVTADPSTDAAEVTSRCQELNRLCSGIRPCPDVDACERAVEAASKSEHWTHGDFAWSGSLPSAKSPVHMFGIGSPVAHIQRVGPTALRLRIDERIDICPLISTPVAWITAPFWLKF